jgi:sugar lactone lactonase YvrE
MTFRLAVGVAAMAAMTATGAFAVSGTDTITTIAGTGQSGYSGDGGPATSAKLFGADGIAVDAQGNVYIADALNYRVRKVTRGGTISTFAGTGKQGFSGDGGPATSAQLTLEQSGDAFGGLAVDAQRNVYIADTFSHRVRKVAPDGTITTFAGTGRQGFFGDGGPATSAQLHYPTGLAVDASGNLYIADRNNGRVRKVSGGTITTVAGSGSVVNRQLGDGGPATAAHLTAPAGLAVDRQGNVYIADPLDSRVRRVSAGGMITTFAGTGRPGFSGDAGPATAARLQSVFGVAVDARGAVYLSELRSHRVRRVSPDGTITTIAGKGAPSGLGGFSGDGGPAASAQLSLPRGIAVDRQGTVYVVVGPRVRKIGGSAPAAGALRLTLGGASSQPLLAQKAITVTARCSRPCSLAATGSVTILGTRSGFGLTRANARLAAAGATKLTLRFAAAEQRRFGRLFRPGQQARAVVIVRATDAAGRTTTSRRTVAVRR